MPEKVLPTMLRIMGTGAPLEENDWSAADVVRLPQGPAAPIGLLLYAVEKAVQFHDIKTVTLEAPYVFHGSDTLRQSRLRSHFAEELARLDDLMRQCLSQTDWGCHLNVFTRWNEQEFRNGTWDRMIMPTQWNIECIDSRLSTSLRRLHTKRPGSLGLIRFPGAAVPFLPSEQLHELQRLYRPDMPPLAINASVRAGLCGQLRLVADTYRANGQLLPKLQMVNHIDCGMLGGAIDAPHELARHRSILQVAREWIRREIGWDISGTSLVDPTKDDVLLSWPEISPAI